MKKNNEKSQNIKNEIKILEKNRTILLMLIIIILIIIIVIKIEW